MVARSVSRESEEGKIMGHSTGAMSVIGNNPMHASGKSRLVGVLVASICVLTLHGWAGGAFAAIGFVQGNNVTKKSHHSEGRHSEDRHSEGRHSEDRHSALSVTYTNAQVAGDLNVVVVGWEHTTATVSSVTDSTGNVYTLAVGPTQNSDHHLSQSIYYARGILAAGASTNTVTVRFTVPAHPADLHADIRVLEYSGLDRVNPVDVTAAATGTSAESNSGAATTTNAHDLIVGANLTHSHTSGPGTGFTERVVTFPHGNIVEDRVVATAGSYSASAPINGHGPWIMQMVAFKAASGGTVDSSPPTNPSNLHATAAGPGGINLSWTASSDNVGVTNYLIERCQGPGCSSFAQVGTSSATTFANTGLLAGTSYSYQVRATDAAGNLSGDSNVSSATTNQSTASPIAFIQLASATPQTAQLAVSVPFASAQTTGNLNVVVVGWSDTTAAVSSVTDSTGNVYTLAVGPTAHPNTVTQSIYYAKNIVGAAGNANTVTVRFTVAASFADVRILEYTGIDPANPVDVIASAIGTNGTANSGAVTTTHGNDLIFGANTVSTSTAGAGAGFTSRVITSPDGDIAEDQVVSAVGSYSASASLTSTGPWVMQMVAFRGALAGTPPPPHSQVGQWSGPFTWPIVAVNMALLPTGRVLAWDGQSNGHAARVWDPSTNSFSSLTVDDNIFCSGAAALPDGRLLVAGGHFQTHVGLNVTNLFDPLSQTWSNAPAMAFDRWYPTVTALPDGRMLVTGGEIDCDGCEATIPEVYSPATNSWTSLSGASLSIPYYPHMFVLPDGRVLNTSTAEAPIPTRALNVQTQTWTTVDASTPDGGSAVMYRPGKFLKTGTSVDPDTAIRPSFATAYTLDMTQGSPAWTQVSSMSFARTYHTMVLLPDGNVLVTNGGQTTNAIGVSTAVHQAELWSPETQQFSRLASMVAPRLYHSTALLLPDGRVLVAGGGRFNDGNAPTDQLSSEIYSPPYLFNGARPVISSTPTVIHYATNFSITTPDASQITSAALVRLGAVTHAFDQNQRYVPLTFQQATGGLTVQSPSSQNLAPPGYYMLFIVNANGVPSVASIIKVQ
jgi:galactose oxidase-like protein/glyoxal oxidase-like protein/fibronectin type III domain protein